MKAKLTFDLPDEQEEFDLAINGYKWGQVAWGLDRWLREEIKYHGREDLQPARDKLNELVHEYELEL